MHGVSEEELESVSVFHCSPVSKIVTCRISCSPSSWRSTGTWTGCRVAEPVMWRKLKELRSLAAALCPQDGPADHLSRARAAAMSGPALTLRVYRWPLFPCCLPNLVQISLVASTNPGPQRERHLEKYSSSLAKLTYSKTP